MRTLIALWVVGLSKVFNKTIELAVIRRNMWRLCGVTVIFKQISTSLKNCFAAPSRQSNNNNMMIFIVTWPTETVSKEKIKVCKYSCRSNMKNNHQIKPSFRTHGTCDVVTYVHKIMTWSSFYISALGLKICSRDFTHESIITLVKWCPCCTGVYVTNVFPIAIHIRWQFRFSEIPFLGRISLQDFARASTAPLSWQVRNLQRSVRYKFDEKTRKFPSNWNCVSKNLSEMITRKWKLVPNDRHLDGVNDHWLDHLQLQSKP